MLIEIRVGPGKRKLVSSILDVKKKCRIPSSKVHRVPHISLYGNFPARWDQVEKVKNALCSIGGKYPFLPYMIDGFRYTSGEKGKVIYFNIVPSQELKEFRKELAQKLSSIVPSFNHYDKKEDFLFHSTLAYKLTDSEFNRIWSYVNNKKSLLQKLKSLVTKSEEYPMRYFYLPMNALRVTFLNNEQKIICEYDFLQKRLLYRRQALDKTVWQNTLRIFRTITKIEGHKEKTNSIYLISDLHLDHANIIHYCARPFAHSNVEEMNRVLVNNWNNIIHNNQVYFLGDLSYGRGARPAEYWRNKLNGKIHSIRGNHYDLKDSKDYEILKHENHEFLLVHDPDKLPIKWKGWIIHGHKHNNDMKNYPFINGDKKTINVSAELINYRPISLDFIISLKLETIKRMDTIYSVPDRKSSPCATNVNGCRKT